MVNWIPLQSVAQIDAIKERSKKIPCVIFKHSTRCSISSLAKHRLEGNWDFDASSTENYFLDLIAHRDISNYIAETFSVHHESPQLLLIRDENCTYDASHLDISVQELKECFQDTF